MNRPTTCMDSSPFCKKNLDRGKRGRLHTCIRRQQEIDLRSCAPQWDIRTNTPQPLVGLIGPR